MKEVKKPPLNQAARIVNSRFLDSDYQGKNWEAVRKCLIKDIENYLSAHHNQIKGELLKKWPKEGFTIARNKALSEAWQVVEEVLGKDK